ncbi:TolC family protein [Methylotuvimicrobium sp. KM2]|uniref:TolC family protein n=1 Tax=Methylotuvimicrobium sp. KM2 TaxID=3133976 RepID=UPI0031018A46
MLELTKTAVLACLLILPQTHAYAQSSELERRPTYTLEDAISLALQNNPDLQIAHERIGQAQAQLGEAFAAFYPQAQIRMSYEHTDNPSRAFGMIISQRRLNLDGSTNFNQPGGTDNYRPEVVATYSLFRGGQDYQAAKAAELGVEAAELQESAVRNQLIEAVTSTYYGLLASAEAHKVALNSIKAVDSELRQSKNQYEAGALLKSDVLSLEVQLAETQDAEIQAANAIELTRTGLKTLLGLNADEAFEFEQASAALQIPENHESFDDLLNRAIKERPEIAAAYKRVEIAERKLSAAKGAHLPRANAYVSYGSDSKNIDFSTNRDNVTAGVMVEMDLFSGFGTSEAVKKAEHQLNEAQKAHTQTKLAIENEVKTAHLKFREALARLNVTRAAIASAEEALRLVNQQRQAGAATVTRYIEAEVARDKAHSRDIAARFDALRAEAELKKALGSWR